MQCRSMESMRLFVVAGLMRRGDQVLLVQQQGPWDTEPTWGLPGGVVEPGERLTEALVREIREETGLEVTDPGQLLYVMQLDSPKESGGYVSFVAEVAGWQGELRVKDPDGYVFQARFLPLSKAIDRLTNHLPWRIMREPIVAYLQGEVGPGTMWLYHRQPDGTDVLVTRVET